MIAPNMIDWNETDVVRLHLNPEEEQQLCQNIRDLEDHLCAILARLDHDLSCDDDTKRYQMRQQLAHVVRSLHGTGELVRSARRVHRTIDRLTWRLALSGMDQVQHQLRRRSYTRVSRDELRQAGVLGLFKAARRFQPGKGVRFSTYCRYWVRDEMGEEVGRLEYAARLPSKARRQLRKEAEDLSSRQARALSRIKRSVDLDATVGGGEDGDAQRYADLLVSKDAQCCPETQTVQRSRMERLALALDTCELKERDRYILARRFGLGGQDRQTNQEIGTDLGISGERVRQLEKRAVDKLRQAFRAA